MAFNFFVDKSIGSASVNLSKSLTKRKPIDLSIMKKSTNAVKVLDNVKGLIEKHLSDYSDVCEFIVDENRLEQIIVEVNEAGIVAIDTETTGLNPMLNDIVGISLCYDATQKSYYIPISHVNTSTMRLDVRQLSKEVILKHLKKITAKVVMHNANFDLRVLRHQLGLDLKIYWDTMIFNKLLVNGKNVSSGLKSIYSNLKGDVSFLSFDDYFIGMTFNLIPIELGYIYASMDALMTLEVYHYQKNLVDTEDDCALSCFGVFRKIEMPIVRIVVEMEDAGVGVDLEYAEKLRVEYEEKIQLAERDALLELSCFDADIERYRVMRGVDCKLTSPININSPIQIAIILYDIMGISAVDKKSPRGTGASILKKIDIPFTNALLRVREYKKLLTTYIEAIPKMVNQSTGRIHTQFNQLGALTGRFSSENPNLQNIPSANKEIRKIFKASEGNCFISCDYSSQEPRIVSQLSGDVLMKKAFTEGLDYYAMLGSDAYHLKYEDCRETFADGSFNAEGKRIREMAKRCYLGLCYGMMDNKLGETLGISREEASDLRNRVLSASPGLHGLLVSSVKFAKKYGYVETYWGRRRYLPNILKDVYEFVFDKTKIMTEIFNPLDFESDDVYDLTCDLKAKYLKKLSKVRWYKQFMSILEEAKREGITIIDNSGIISEAERQAVNTRVQGSAADMTKLGMINIYKNKELKELGFHLLLAVHDELIGECPIENAKRCGELMQECMLEPASDFSVPFKCDLEISTRWYGEPLEV